LKILKLKIADSLKTQVATTENPRFYLRLPALKSYIPLPTAEELESGNFISSMPSLASIQETSKELEWNYALPENVKDSESLSNLLQFFKPAI
jgi:hypothetical protein